MCELSAGELEARMRNVNHDDFRKIVGGVWQRQGWNTSIIANDIHVKCVKSGPDGDTVKAIQCHRHAIENPVNKTHVEAHTELAARSDIDKIIIVTTSEFTEGARRKAQSLGIQLMDSTAFARTIKENEADDFVIALTEPTLREVSLGRVLRRGLRKILPGN
ncbi:restriction endonuclease [Halorhabdus salina]|uniref:restriction endonuclease n=1 Tax=Halorhabdus salina TaxID=2750670 RepID=UPI0015EF6250|nr:restriction endonuclease [Halorhabdus salina]